MAETITVPHLSLPAISLQQQQQTAPLAKKATAGSKKVASKKRGHDSKKRSTDGILGQSSSGITKPKQTKSRDGKLLLS